MSNRSDAFGFRFWLFWILQFGGSFLLAALFWTGIMIWAFKEISEPELVLTWSVSVFGSWFLLLTPFMRKKEQIWKRLNQDEEKAVDAALQGMGAFIGLLIASAFFWIWRLRPRVFLESSGRLDPLWTKAVFGTWLFLTLPFLILLYRKADQIFKAAVMRQTADHPKFSSIFVERSKRLLPDEISRQLRAVPETLQKGHVVHLVLKNGRRIPHAFVLNSNEILGLYEKAEFDFNPKEIVGIEPVNQMPVYDETKWLRLDGRV